MKAVILGAVCCLFALFSLNHADRWHSPRTITVNVSCLTDTHYDPLQSEEVTELIKGNAALYSGFLQALTDVSNSTFNLTVYVRTYNGVSRIDFRRLYRVNGAIAALTPFYEANVKPLLFAEPSHNCEKQIESLLKYYTANATIRDSFVAYVKANIATYANYIKTKFGVESVNLDKVIDEQAVTVLNFINANAFNATITVNGGGGHGDSGEDEHGQGHH